MTEETLALETPTKRVSKNLKPYISVCMVVRDTARHGDLFENALKSVRRAMPEAEIVIVETCSRASDNGKTVEVAQKYADVFEVYRGPRGDWNEEMAAVDNMSAARQRAMELATGTWMTWVDHDDRLATGEEAEQILKEAGKWKPVAPAQDVVADAPSAGTIEELLRWIEKNDPETTLIYCPYLYRKDKDGHAEQWLERERFARIGDDKTRFRWAEAGHELLVPREGYTPPRVDLPHLVWVHEKDWNSDEALYSLHRHAKILLAQHDSGDKTHRRARYLSGFAGMLPELASRELEFLNEALRLSYTEMDRYHSHNGLGAYYARRGLLWESKDHFAAAKTLRNDLPDAFYASGEAAAAREDWFTAVNELRAGVKLPLGLESEVNPRYHAVRYPSLLGVALQKAAEQATLMGQHQVAYGLLLEARDLALKVKARPEVGRDYEEAHALAAKAENSFFSQKTILGIHEAWQHLRNNDETQKALLLVKSIPFDKEHHPLTIEMEAWAKQLKEHIENPLAYANFYNVQETGWLPLSADKASYEKAHPRIKWTIDWIKKNAPTSRVLDIGCCDGLAGLPLLQECKEINYVGIDVGEKFLDHFRRLVDTLEIDTGINGRIGTKRYSSKNSRVELRSGTIASALEPDEKFDVIVAGEIIEHVPDPVIWLIRLRHRLNKGGTLLLTTPWGSFDEGHPPATTAFGTKRDERGHLRAYSAWQLTQDLRKAGFHVEEVSRVAAGAGVGDAAVAVATPLSLSEYVASRKSVAVAVPSALWKWNGTTVAREGIGASETQIVLLGEKMTLASNTHVFDVFGPVPSQEVQRGVGYFEREAIRKIDKHAKILVSRSPSYIKVVDELVGHENPAVLWLQDTYYNDLNNESAKRFETIVCVSAWHKAYTIEKHGLNEENASKVVVIPNHLDSGLYRGLIETQWSGVKALSPKPRFVYASSPDRGLVKLLELWPRVLEMFPEATLRVFYGWRGAAKLGAGHDSAWNQRYLNSRRRYEELRHQRGIQEVGMVNRFQMAMEFFQATALLYPGDFFETFGTVAPEAAASGCVPVVSDLAGLQESAAIEGAWRIGAVDKGTGRHLVGYDEEWLVGVQRAALMPMSSRQEMARDALNKFGWESVSYLWSEVLK